MSGVPKELHLGGPLWGPKPTAKATGLESQVGFAFPVCLRFDSNWAAFWVAIGTRVTTGSLISGAPM